MGEYSVKKMAFFLVSIAFISSCAESVRNNSESRILFMGDSLFAWNRASGRSVSDVVERALQEPVIDRSIVGARIIYPLPISGSLGMNIEKQYRVGNWDWVILNGGGNDLWLGCGCYKCDYKMNRMISYQGTSGQIPDLVRRIRSSGARVVYVGYLRSPGINSIIEGCRNEGDEFERRIQEMEKLDDGVFFVNLRGLVPFGDRSFFSFDMIHPSIKGSQAIGDRIAAVIATESTGR